MRKIIVMIISILFSTIMLNCYSDIDEHSACVKKCQKILFLQLAQCSGDAECISKANYLWLFCQSPCATF